ncbi:MAG: tRNA (adenosine(37)-N6)-threonylcarbamoyltransferase complex transferase subunit TsaD [Candidatus Shikimatogenerans bostrichidophilus]|nr:MAG: tRNA (adenosine(37)-N6)-threonylcarbamoyltransferase complex transferase subunit TsaD [Candidatus Shikimatogenerans bostrichidophilus]
MKNIFNKNKIILGIETSFDDTCCAIIKNNKILSNKIYTQKIHKKYNGVKPIKAYNLHLIKIYKIVKLTIEEARIKINDLDGIAYTKGPGLVGSLMIGENFAKSMALSLRKPLLSINHIHGHIYSIFIYKKRNKYPKFPYICLSMSGGHTCIYKIDFFFKNKLIGKTLDDNLGNLFDYFGKLLGFKYPYGVNKISKYSLKGKYKYKFPIPKINGFNFSFSGLKTYLKNFIKNKKKKKKKKIFVDRLKKLFF